MFIDKLLRHRFLYIYTTTTTTTSINCLGEALLIQLTPVYVLIFLNLSLIVLVSPFSKDNLTRYSLSVNQ